MSDDTTAAEQLIQRGRDEAANQIAELRDILAEVVAQAGTVGENSDRISHCFISAYEMAFDALGIEKPIVTREEFWRLVREHEPRRVNTLQHELLDLITLMPDSQTQEILDYITTLRETRRKRDA